ncbi:hypothetical protein HYW20_00720 [Candidatus Woesearchaeota archaeon]|nr:hypothetical protein [Candidatus Woesearchaeota archaeon]
MKKIFLISIAILAVLMIACKPATQVPADVMQKPAATSDAAVDAVGTDINNVDSVEKDLSTNDLGDLDSGLSDVENI